MSTASIFECAHPQVALYAKEAASGYRPARTQDVLAAAQTILSQRLPHGQVLGTPLEVKEYLKVRLAALDYEVFAMVLLDTQNRLLKYLELFRGTLTQTSVYPREVVREALRHNAAAAILVHNHPSGSVEPSKADEVITRALKDALELLDVRVLDHIIVGGLETLSFAERGLI